MFNNKKEVYIYYYLFYISKYINIAWSKKGANDSDYQEAFEQIIIPQCTEFKPDMILVSCGFDAVTYDPTGECLLTPKCINIYNNN